MLPFPLPTYPDPTVWAIPLYVLSMIVEARLVRRWHRDGKKLQIQGYERRDTFASIALGVGSLLSVTAINMGVYSLAGRLWSHRLWDLGTGPLGWIVALVGWDLAYYWHHRAEHRIRILWACHENHHSSQRFNLSTALRQPWTPVAGLLFYPPLALLGVRPDLIMLALGCNLLYQFWVHTEVVDRLPRWFEFIFNTASHHRVHHGKNPQYLDKNYAGILILWDRLFGSFAPEQEPVVYGLTHNVDSYNPLYLAFHEYATTLRLAFRTPRWSHKLAYLLRGPEWRPPTAPVPPQRLS